MTLTQAEVDDLDLRIYDELIGSCTTALKSSERGWSNGAKARFLAGLSGQADYRAYFMSRLFASRLPTGEAIISVNVRDLRIGTLSKSAFSVRGVVCAEHGGVSVSESFDFAQSATPQPHDSTTFATILREPAELSSREGLKAIAERTRKIMNPYGGLRQDRRYRSIQSLIKERFSSVAEESLATHHVSFHDWMKCKLNKRRLLDATSKLAITAVVLGGTRDRLELSVLPTTLKQRGNTKIPRVAIGARLVGTDQDVERDCGVSTLSLFS